VTETAAPPSEAPAGVSITVDGRPFVARPGELIISAAERAGVFIPRFCYHPRMKPVGMCRMCLVEVVGPRGPSLQPACFVAVAEGQEIHTASPTARKAQDGVLELLLVNHPLDCPVCDKGGECPLQDQTMSYGPGESRFHEEKRHFEKPIAISDLVQLDRERCIQCARCTRFAEEIAGEPLIAFQGRGDRVEVNVFPGHPFASYFSGNTVQICPVGALTATPYRFQARPWDLEQAETTCTVCAVGCRVAAQSSAGRLVRYLGIDVDAVNQSWLCDKGRFGYEWIDSDTRLGTPLVRRDGELVPASWTAALKATADDVKDAIAAGGPERVAVIGGARLANEDAYAWARLAKSVIGTDSVDAQLDDGLPAELVLGLPRATIDDACSARAVVLLAPDLREEMPVLYLRLRHAAVEDHIPLVELGPVPTALAEHARASLCYRPGEAAFAARALVADEVAAPAGSAPPAALDPEELAHARAVLGAAAGAGTAPGEGIVIVLGRPSLAESAEGIADAASMMAAAWPAARFLPVLRRANVHGALDMGLSPGLLPGRVTLEGGRDWYSADDAWGTVPAASGRDARSILEAAAAGEIEVLLLLGADPLSDFPDHDLAQRALDRVRSVICVDTLSHASTAVARIVLPAAAHGERAGTTTNCEGRVSRLAQKIVAPGVAWPDWMIASEIASALGGDLGFESLESIAEEIERLAPSHRGLTHSVLISLASRDGVVLPIPEVAVGSAGISLRIGHSEPIDPIATPGIRSVEVQGAPIRSGAALMVGGPEADGPASAGDGPKPAGSGRPPLVRHAATPVTGTPPPLDRYSMRLVTRRHLYDQGAQLGACSSLAPLARRQRLHANPAEVESLGVVAGDKVRVRSPKATLVVEIEPDATVPKGVVVLGFNTDGAEGGRASHLIDSSLPVVDVRVETT
jgi:NADH-quinone oxidoreductase subunit G